MHPYSPEKEASLRTAMLDLEQWAGQRGWDDPTSIHALVLTANALAKDERMAESLGPEVVAAAEQDPYHLLSIEQSGLPVSENLGHLLMQLAWPDTVDGCALVTEQLLFHPEIEASLPEDPSEEDLQAARADPRTDELRIVAGVLRSGESWCILRVRSKEDTGPVGSPDAVPDLVQALKATLQ